MKRLFAWLSVIVVMSVITGCATLADARAEKGKGLSRVYNADVETVWKTLPPTLTSMGLAVVGDNRSEGYLLAQRGMTMLSYGENVAIFVERADAKRTRVEVVSKRALATNLFAPDWAPEVLDKLEQALKR